MFCIKCGAEIPANANFCAACGTTAVDVEATKIALPKGGHELQENENNDLEHQIFSIRPTLLFIHLGYAFAVMSAFLLVILLYYFDKLVSFGVPWWLSVFAGFGLLLIPAYYHFKRNMIRYTLTDSKVKIDEGFISRNTRNIPLRTIQDVMVKATIPQRLMGFGDLIIENASESDGKIVLKSINHPHQYADALLNQMRKQ